jgi:LacI family transcriptional regulator
VPTRKRQLQSPGKPPTTYDIAARCGVNQSTVSRALQGGSGVGKDTIERILAVATEMGYDPMNYQEARRLISRRYGTTALSYLISAFFYHPGFSQSTYFARMFQGVLDAVSETDFEIVTSDYVRSKISDNRYDLPPVFRRGDIDGVLVMTQDAHWQPCRKLMEGMAGQRCRPAVGLVEPITGCSAVYPDNLDAGYRAASHLLELGHRRIMAFYTGMEGERSVQGARQAGIRKAFSERGLDIAQHLTIAGAIPHAGDEISEMFRYGLKINPDVTAIMAANDFEAQTLYRTIVELGLSVPGDLSLVSFDDTDAIADGRGNNILTTVRLPLHEIGVEGTRLVIRKIMGVVTDEQDVVLPVDLIVRGSTASPRKGRLRI